MHAMTAGTKVIAENRRARHEYRLLDRYEAGLVLTGTEVKSLRDGKATLQRAFGDVREGEVFLVGLHIPEYTQGTNANHDPDRERKLLLHRREIDQLVGKVQEKGLTLVPTRLYWKNGRAKVAEGALQRGLAVAERLHLRTGQGETGLVALEEVVLVARAPVLRDDFGPCAHRCIGPKKFAEPGLLSSPSPANLPLPRRAYR